MDARGKLCAVRKYGEQLHMQNVVQVHIVSGFIAGVIRNCF